MQPFIYINFTIIIANVYTIILEQRGDKLGGDLRKR